MNRGGAIGTVANSTTPTAPESIIARRSRAITSGARRARNTIAAMSSGQWNHT